MFLKESDMQTVLPQNASQEIAREWLIEIINYVGPGFHPDTDASDYIDISTGNQLFSCKEAEEINRSLETVFAVLDDPYEIGLPVALKLLKQSIQTN